MKKDNSKKWVPMAVMSSLVFSTLAGIGGTAFAAELDESVSAVQTMHDKMIGKVENSKEAAVDRNHGQTVSEIATQLPGGPGKGAIISRVARDKDNTDKEQANQEPAQVTKPEDKSGGATQAENTVKADEAEKTAPDVKADGTEKADDAANREGSVKTDQSEKSDDTAKADGSQQPSTNWYEVTYRDIVNDYRSLIDSYQMYVADWFGEHQTQTPQSSANANTDRGKTEAAPPATDPNASPSAETSVGVQADPTAAKTDVQADGASVQETAVHSEVKPDASSAGVETKSQTTTSNVQVGQPSATTADQTAVQTAEKPVQTEEKSEQTPVNYDQTNTTSANTTNVSESADKTVQNDTAQPQQIVGEYSVYEKLIDYYTKLVNAYQSFVSLLK